MSSENTRSLSRSEILCHLCDPPKVICKSDLSDTNINKILRNHAAAHQMLQTYPNEPCGLCSIRDCSPQVQITVQNRNSILSGTKLIPPGADVHHNCKTYTVLPPTFPYKYCNKATRGYPCMNRPILCHDCEGVMVFVWSWNIELHYQNKHGGMTDEQADKYKGCFITEEEKAEIKKYFKVNVNGKPT